MIRATRDHGQRSGTNGYGRTIILGPRIRVQRVPWAVCYRRRLCEYSPFPSL